MTDGAKSALPSLISRTEKEILDEAAWLVQVTHAFTASPGA